MTSHLSGVLIPDRVDTAHMGGPNTCIMEFLITATAPRLDFTRFENPGDQRTMRPEDQYRSSRAFLLGQQHLVTISVLQFICSGGSKSGPCVGLPSVRTEMAGGMARWLDG